ncbi:MAG: hypothetical protein E7043_00525 [Lentisphaerae bacterium]|nr:hypothetical protein [Lentisphaerota bacterium]
MIKKVLIFLFVLSVSCLQAAEKNLVLNGTFEMKGKSFPPFWMFRSHTPGTVEAFETGGPNGLGFLRVHARKGLIQVIQNNISIAKKGQYRISAFVRTRNLTGKRNCVAIHPGAKDSGLIFPADQPEWKYIEKIHSGYSDGNSFYFAIEADSPDGVLDIADLKIVPLDAPALKKSRRQIENVDQALVPLALLEYIDLNHPEMEFFWVGEIPGKAAELRWEFLLGSRKLTEKFSTKKFTVDLGKLSPAAGKNTLTASLIDRDGKKVFSQKYPVRFIRKTGQAEPAKRLNNMVRVVYEGKIAANGSKKFFNPRNNYVLFRYTGNEKPELSINGKTVLAADFPHGSGVRYLDAGEYTLKNSGAECDISIRLIPDMHMFPLWHIRVPGNGAYDWEFAKKYMLPALTTINIGGIGEIEKKEVERFGLRFLSNASAIKFGTPEGLLKRLEENKDLQGSLFDGTTMDEVEYWSCKVPSPYAKGLRLWKNPKDKILSTWVIGPPTHSYADFISAVTNVSGGRGRLLYEVYNRAQYNKTDAENYIRQTAQHVALYKDISPGLFNNISVILGNFSYAPLISLDNIPTVDFRYYLDMQMNLLANHPGLDGLGGVGYWGSMNCDEEILRWCFALLKHYCIEGNTTMLSDKYGFTYHLNILKNPDFEDGLNNWQVTGKVEAGKKKDFGSKFQKRYGSAYTQGDTFALFTREEGQPSEVRQKITGLTPGKLYSVYYMAADYDDVQKEKYNAKRIGLTLTIPGAVIIRRSYFIDDRKSMKACMNSCKYIFRAKSSEAELVFNNRKALPGEKQMLNYITVRPYFER